MNKRNGYVFKVALFALAICAVVASALFIENDNPISWTFLVMSALAVIIILIEIIIAQRNIKKYIFKMNEDIAITEKESLYYFPAPAIIMDEDNTIVWYNKLFEERMFSEKEAYGEHLTSLIDIDINKLYTQNGDIILHNGNHYRGVATRPNNENVKLSMVYFEDISEFKALEKEHFLSRPAVILIMLDNYDDLLQNVKESDKAHIIVEIEKLLENFIENTTGILRRISNDRYVTVVEERHLREMLETRFDILDKAREIMVDERYSVTLSIGVGRGGATLKEDEVFAKQSLDMALGRGGDQCAVKTINGFEFFGGVSKGIEKRTKVKTRIIAAALKELIEGKENVYIMGHRFGDLDSIGSAVGLCSVINDMNINASVVVDPEKNLSKKLIRYVKENETYNMFISPEQALNEVNDNTLLIIVDTHNPDFVDSRELYEKSKHVVVIDHHRKMVNFIDDAVIFYHEPYASSACEMVAELIQYFSDDCKISASIAEALLSGIMLDTKNFVMRTGVRTFEAAAFLRRQGADTVVVKTLFSSSIETYQQKSRLVANAEIYHKCAIACSDSNSDKLRIAAPQAADELLGISDVLASFVLFEINDIVNISARSMGGFNVQVIMETLGGGGHQTMAGVQLQDISIEEAKHKLIEAIDDFVKKTS